MSIDGNNQTKSNKSLEIHDRVMDEAREEGSKESKWFIKMIIEHSSKSKSKRNLKSNIPSTQTNIDKKTKMSKKYPFMDLDDNTLEEMIMKYNPKGIFIKNLNKH